MTVAERQGLAPVRRRLDNGAVVLARESRATPAVTISATVEAGVATDPADMPGVAHFLSRVIDRGTETRTAEQVADLLDRRGVSLNIAVMRHLFAVSCTCLAEDFQTMLDLVADVVRRPGLPETEIATRRGEIVTAIRQDQDNPAMVAVEEVLALLYPGDHPYGRRVKGTVGSVERIDRRALAALHHDRFVPSSLIVACVGDVEPGRVVGEVERAFGDWGGYPARPVFVPEAPRVSARRRAVFPMMNKAQADIAYAFDAIARRDPAYCACTLMNNVLGQYGLGGRLGDNIRERQGMAYYAFSAFEPNVGRGPLVIRAGVSPANVDRTIEAIDAEVRRMATDGPTPEELAAAKRYLIGSMPRTLETNAGIATFLQVCEQFGLGEDYDVRLPGLLDAVTLDEAHAAAARLLAPERATIAVAGPYQEAAS